MTPEEIKAWRISHNISARNLAKIAGMRFSSILDFEAGRKSLSLNNYIKLTETIKNINDGSIKIGKQPRKLAKWYDNDPHDVEPI